MRGRSKRDPVKEQFWRKALARFATSGLTAAQFCQREGLSRDLLRYWDEVIAERDKERRLEERQRVQGTDQTFLPVTVSSQKGHDRLPGTQQMAVAEIVFSGGSVFIFNGITADTLRVLCLAMREGTS